MPSATEGPMLKTSNVGYDQVNDTIFMSEPGDQNLVPPTPPLPVMKTRSFGYDPFSLEAWTSEPGNQALVQIGVVEE
jgi:hypothetical protein